MLLPGCSRLLGTTTLAHRRVSRKTVRISRVRHGEGGSAVFSEWRVRVSLVQCKMQH